jgi:hypothetical protein
MRCPCLVLAGTIACGPTVAVDEAVGSTTAIATSTTGAGPDISSGTTSVATDAGTTAEPGSTSSSIGDAESGVGNFIEGPDGGSAAIECDVWHQDCPPGEKCMP